MCTMCGYGCGNGVMVRGQLCGAGLTFHPHMSSGDQTRTTRLVQQTPLASEPAHEPHHNIETSTSI